MSYAFWFGVAVLVIVILWVVVADTYITRARRR